MALGWAGSKAMALCSLAGLILCAQSDELVRKSQYGKQLMSAGRFAEAIPVYQDLVRALPGNPGLLLNLALAEHMAGQPRQAIPHFEAVLKIQPASLPALLSLGASHLELNEPRAAVEPLRKVVSADAGNREARGMLAGALFESGRFEQAAGQYRALVQLSSSDPRAWFGLGRSYESLATQAFAQLQKSAPQSGYMAALIADSRVQRRQYRSAFYFYQQARLKIPALREVYAGLAEVYRRTGHPDWAAVEEQKEQALPPAASLDSATAARLPSTPEGMYRRIRAYNDLARQAYAELGKLPDSAQIHEVKANILRGQGQHLESANEWRQALRLEPGNPQYERELAQSLYLAGDYRSALPILQRFLQSDPESAQLNLLEGDSLLHLDEAGKAIPYLEKAVRRDPKLAGAHASLGLAYAREGRSAVAIPHLEAALPVDEDGSLHYQLGRAYQAAGDAGKAERTLAQYQELQKKAQAEKDEVEKEAQILPPPQQ